MSIKHKEAILEILEKSGPLSGTVLKERILSRMHLDDESYPKSTYFNHLQQLFDDFKILYKTEDNKRIYFIKNFEHETPGGLILENLEGKITVPAVLKPFSPKITQGYNISEKSQDFNFFFEFNSTHICFSIHKDSFPFKLHISRSKSDDISKKVIEIHGSRIIILELPIAKISSFKDDKHSGHVLIDIFDLNKIKISDLGATNSAVILKIKNLSHERYLNDFSFSSSKTLHNDWVDKNKDIIDRTMLKPNSTAEAVRPVVIMLTSDSSLYVF